MLTKTELQYPAHKKFELGLNYYYGSQGPQDRKKAIELWEHAAKPNSKDGGNANAQFNLGICYSIGISEVIPKDKKRAFELYRLAAEQGHARAQYNLAVYYANGNVVEKNVKIAAKLYHFAAHQGDTKAQYNLGICYAYGIGVSQDWEKAFKLFEMTWANEKSSPRENTLATFALGLCNEKGLGTIQDVGRAFHFYDSAATKGHSLAQKELERLKYCPSVLNNVSVRPKSVLPQPVVVLPTSAEKSKTDVKSVEEKKTIAENRGPFPEDSLIQLGLDSNIPREFCKGLQAYVNQVFAQVSGELKINAERTNAILHIDLKERVDRLSGNSQRFYNKIINPLEATFYTYKIASTGLFKRDDKTTAAAAGTIVSLIGKAVPLPFSIAFEIFGGIITKAADYIEGGRYVVINAVLPMMSALDPLVKEIALDLLESARLFFRRNHVDFDALTEREIIEIAKRVFTVAVYTVYQVYDLNISNPSSLTDEQRGRILREKIGLEVDRAGHVLEGLNEVRVKAMERIQREEQNRIIELKRQAEMRIAREAREFIASLCDAPITRERSSTIYRHPQAAPLALTSAYVRHVESNRNVHNEVKIVDSNVAHSKANSR